MDPDRELSKLRKTEQRAERGSEEGEGEAEAESQVAATGPAQTHEACRRAVASADHQQAITFLCLCCLDAVTPAVLVPSTHRAARPRGVHGVPSNGHCCRCRRFAQHYCCSRDYSVGAGRCSRIRSRHTPHHWTNTAMNGWRGTRRQAMEFTFEGGREPSTHHGGQRQTHTQGARALPRDSYHQHNILLGKAHRGGGRRRRRCGRRGARRRRRGG